MIWLDTLQVRDEVWEGFKADLLRLKRLELDKVLSVPPAQVERQIGRAEGIQRLYDLVTQKERIDGARGKATRCAGKSDRGAGRPNVKLYGRLDTT